MDIFVKIESGYFYSKMGGQRLCLRNFFFFSVFFSFAIIRIIKAVLKVTKWSKRSDSFTFSGFFPKVLVLWNGYWN